MVQWLGLLLAHLRPTGDLPFNALTLSVGRQEEHPVGKKDGCLLVVTI